MAAIRTMIVDDEPLGRQRIRDLVKKNDGLKLVAESEDLETALKIIPETAPDLIFLDIRLGEGTGFDLLEKLKLPSLPLIIFVTAYDDYAVKAFEYSAIDYLLKPFSDERFQKALKHSMVQLKTRDSDRQFQKINEILNYVKGNEAPHPARKSKLAIKVGNKTNFINKEDIKYVTASGYYVEIYTHDKKHVLRSSLTNLMEVLNQEKFVRIHRSTIINMDEILEIIHSDYGEVDVKMTDLKLFRLSKSFKKSFFDLAGL